MLTAQGSIAGRGNRFLFTAEHPDRLWFLPRLLFNWYWGLGDVSLAVKRLGREADYSPPSTAVAKSGGATLPLIHMSSRSHAYLTRSTWEQHAAENI
jgi:hypothetical protein